MTTAEIKAVQRAVGTEPDGVWGPKSIAAWEKAYARFAAEHPELAAADAKRAE